MLSSEAVHKLRFSPASESSCKILLAFTELQNKNRFGFSHPAECKLEEETSPTTVAFFVDEFFHYLWDSWELVFLTFDLTCMKPDT